MDLFDTTSLALQRAIEGAGLRHRALAENLANVNTPGYRRKDVDFHAALRGALASGDPQRIASADFSPQVDATAGAKRADGNTVDMDVESANLAANGLEYEALTSIVRARLDIVQSAVGAAR